MVLQSETAQLTNLNTYIVFTVGSKIVCMIILGVPVGKKNWGPMLQ